MSKGSFTGPRSPFLAEQLNFSVLPSVFSWKILIEQKGLCCSQKFDNAKAGSSALFLNFPFSQVSTLLFPWPFQVCGMGGAGRRDGVLQAVLLVEFSASKASREDKGGSCAERAFLVEQFLTSLPTQSHMSSHSQKCSDFDITNPGHASCF